MEQQFRDDVVENLVSNQFPPTISQQQEENEIDDDGMH